MLFSFLYLLKKLGFIRKNTVVGFVKPKCLLTPVIISHPVLRAKKAQKTIQLYSNQAESQRENIQ